MELGTLTLQGVTRFRDQVEIDFASLGPGVIAFTGRNGSGKTTALECSGPTVLYHVMPSRSPSKLPAWIGPDGAAIHLTFSHAGDDFEAAVRVARDGTQTAALSRNGIPLVTGKVRDYRAFVNRAFGTRDAFLASVFGCQGGAGRFEALTVGERKAIFRWYLGLDVLDELRTTVGQRRDEIDSLRMKTLKGDLRVAGEAIAACKEGIAEATAGVQQATVARDKAAKRCDRLMKHAAQVKLLAAYDRATDHLFDLQDELAELVTNSEPNEPSAPNPTDDDLARAEDARDKAQEQWDEHCRLTVDLGLARDQFVRAEAQEVEIKERAAKAADIPCKARGKFRLCPLLLDAQEGEADLPVVTLATDDAAQAIKDLEGQIAMLPDHLDVKVRNTNSDLEQCHEAQQRWELYEQEVQGRDREIAELEAAITKAKNEARAIHDDLPADMPADLPAQSDIDQAEQHKRQAQSDLDDAVRTEAHLTAELARARADREKTQADLDKLQDRARDLDPLNLLWQALGPAGVQAYEVAAAGPRVATLANDLLSACYGPRFQIEVQTLRDLKTRDGQAEDFQIRVHDGKYGVAHDSIAGVSKGEQVIVDEALRMALSLFSAERMNNNIKTLWRDETTGGLDADNAVRYVRMLHRARDLGGFHQVLYVTHDTAAVESADAVLRFGDDGTIAALLPGA
jgi:DNA repair exonuclease SbcCD ATPase subunit